ncbi:NB-ARC domain-containing protein [Streptomyces sp. NPDC050315]|uniref:ATP-binding protein n=1 Tax=Streptomyces sp. NPDC050315 TaxID=3155039 RepID=UPI00342BD24E
METRELVGRRSELAQVRQLLEKSRLVTLTGVGGVGKTRLALRAAYEAQPSFRDGAWWVELSSLHRGDLLAHIIAEALPPADRTTRPMIDVLADYLADRELLLVLDTCEHLTDACALAVEVLLRAAPGLRVLVTSRRLLGVVGEEVFAVEPLPVPAADAGADTADAVDEVAAVALLAARAAEVVPGFAVTDANRADVVRLCRRLEGLPLALELAAARLREWPVADLAKRLADRFAVLGETNELVDGAEPPWHQTLRTAIGWSHELCRPSARLLWARLSVFAGTFDAEAARQVCADEHLPDEQVLDLLTALVDKSILIWQPTGSGERYRMLDTIREFGAGWLQRLGEQDELARRHRDYYRALAERADAGWLGPDQIAWRDRTVAEHANLRAALDHCLAEGDGRGAQEMGGALWFFWGACGYAREGRHYLNRALALGPTTGPIRAKALLASALSATMLGDAETVLPLASAFREAAADDTDDTVHAAAYLEVVHLMLLGGHARAVELIDTTPRPRPGHGRYEFGWFMAWMSRPFAHLQLGEFTAALATAEELTAECARRGETWARSWGEYLRALALLALGRTEEAASHARTALDGKRRLHDSTGIGMVLDLLASAVVTSGDGEQAARLLGTAERIWHTLGTPQAGIPGLVAARTACEQQARRILGDDAYETAFRTGYDTDPHTGIAYALTPPATAPRDAEVD